MDTTPPTLVVVAGPIASGKSTLAGALRDDLLASGEKVALVGLDEIAAMALPPLPDWDTAHRIFVGVVAAWLRTPLTYVVAEGPGTPTEVSDLLDEVPPGAGAVTVVLTSPFEVAFARAQADPTRGLSKDRAFLGRMYESWARDLPGLSPDLLLDTSEVDARRSVALVRTELSRPRDLSSTGE